MAAVVDKTTRKIVLDLKKGTQTISPLASGATDEQVYNAGIAVSTLIGSQTQAVQLVETEYIIDNGEEEAGE